MLALLGERVNSLSLRQSAAPRQGTARWYRVARAVMRRPVPVAVGVTLVLLVAASPLTRATLDPARQRGGAGGPRCAHGHRHDRLRVHTESRRADRRHGAGRGGAARSARASTGWTGCSPSRAPLPLRRGEALIQATPGGDPLSPEAQDTARRIRSISTAATGDSRVGGTSAEFVDFKQSLLDHAPLVAGLILPPRSCCCS